MDCEHKRRHTHRWLCADFHLVRTYFEWSYTISKVFSTSQVTAEIVSTWPIMGEVSTSPKSRLQEAAYSLQSQDSAALAAGQLQNKVQAVLPRPCHPLWSQPGVSDWIGPVSRHQQITFRATLIFHLIDGLFSTTAAHEARRAGVLTCMSRYLECSAWPHPHRGWSCQVLKTAEITLF